MEKLTIEHLAPYLPYNISLQFIIREDVVRTGVMTRLLNYSHETHPERVAIDYYDSEHIWMFKPILRPLSDLDAKHFNELQLISSRVQIGINYVWFDGAINLNTVREVEQYLIKNHFDVFGLIEKGLAIDINTLDI